MLDIQEREGNCEVGTGQRPNHLKEGNDDDNDYDDDVKSKTCMSEIQLLMITISLKRDAGQVSR
jgi:hypothetical protein